MSLVRSIARRQEGFEFINDYDVALYRLKCYHYDVCHGISPNTNTLDYNPEPPICACRFCSKEGNEEILALANEDGKIALKDTSIKGKSDQILEGTRAHNNAIFDIAWMPGELKLVTASGDHTARLWDVSRSEIKQIQFFHAHTRSVKTAVFRHQDKAVFATGARDGSIMIWDIRANHNDQPKADNCISNAHNIVSSSNRHRKGLNHTSCVQSITSLAFQDDFSLLSCAAGDGMIKVWDLRKNYTVHKKDPLAKHVMNYAGGSRRNGFSSLLVCPARITLYASCMDNFIYAYNISSYNPNPVAEFYGHQNFTYYIKTCLSPDGKYLASGSSDELAYIWNTKRPGKPIIKLSGHTEEVTCITWCPVGETKIVTCSDDLYHRIWRIGYEHKIDNEEIEVRGRAEAVVNAIVLENSKLETTPTTSLRYVPIQDHTPESDTALSTTPGSSDLGKQSRDVYKQSSSTNLKRTYSQMAAGKSFSDGKFKTILSPIQENMEMKTKRIHIETRGARRLFSPSTDKTVVHTTGNISESDEPSTSTSAVENKNTATESQNTSIPFSPTSNLPNFVLDGTAPHLQMSPEKFKENVDWLTRIREKYREQKMKTSLEKVSNSKITTPTRRTGRSKSMEPLKGSKSCTSPAASLFDFFKVSNKDCDKNICSENSNTTSSTIS